MYHCTDHRYDMSHHMSWQICVYDPFLQSKRLHRMTTGFSHLTDTNTSPGRLYIIFSTAILTAGLRCFSPCSFIHGGLLCYGLNGPNCLRCFCCRTRPLNSGDDLTVKLDGQDCSFRGQIRQFTLTNLNSYGPLARDSKMVKYDSVRRFCNTLITSSEEATPPGSGSVSLFSEVLACFYMVLKTRPGQKRC